MRACPGGVAILLSLTAALPCQAQTVAALTLSGRVAHPASLSMADLAKLPPVTLDLPAKPGQAAPHVTGVPLWTLLDRAGWSDLPGRKTHLQHVVLARGRDGYAVAVSIGEIDPALEGEQVLVVTARDGKQQPTLELAVPGDHKAARHVKDLVALDVQ